MAALSACLWLQEIPAAEPASPVQPASPPPGRSVVINEIMYHPAGDLDNLQWIELLNPTDRSIDLGGWEFSKGVHYQFPAGTRLDPGKCQVVCRDLRSFRLAYGSGIPGLGNLDGRLKHSGETLVLSDANGRRIDAVTFADVEPWPIAPDGNGSSLERISPFESGDLADNWAPSPPSTEPGAGGTPGRLNAAAQPNLPPRLADLGFTTPAPAQPMPVTVTVTDPDGVRDVRLQFLPLSVGLPDSPREPSPAWREIPAARVSGDARQGTYRGEIPGQPEGRLLRFRVIATDTTGSTRITPHPAEARPTWSVYIGGNRNDAQIPFAWLCTFGEVAAPENRPLPGKFAGPRIATRRWSGPAAEVTRGNAALLLMPVKGGAVQVFDHIRITPRKGGWKVRLHKDRLCEGMSTVNVIFESQPRWVLSEHLAYVLYEASGVPAPRSGYWRVWFDGRPVGYQLYIEQPNASFLRRTGRDADGDLFKLLWYGDGVVGQHEKKNNPETGHEKLLWTLRGLNDQRGEAQWHFIQSQFNVPECINYYAVNMCIQNWDGFFNNYFIYRSPGRDGAWEIIPWDEDKTWGDYDGASSDYDWVSMPLSTGMAGDRPTGSLWSFLFSGPFGGASWWRPPGWFSGPLLANPQFRDRFLQRLREVCQTSFTPQGMEAAIARVRIRLEPEVRFRAEILHDQSPESAVEAFHRHIASFRLQVEQRRAFILRQLPASR